MTRCFHCGDDCGKHPIEFQDKDFCCNGCKTVYQILSENDLSYYYELENNPGITPNGVGHKFDFLENEAIVSKLLEFQEGHTSIVSFLIPGIHCSSCIWVLENLSKLLPAVRSSTVNFPEKTIRITFNSEKMSLRELVTTLSHIGYEPYISLDDMGPNKKKTDHSLIYKLGVAGFAFGNIMFLSFPEYFEVSEFWLERFKHLFRWLMFAFAVPVVFYSGRDYFISAFKGLRSRILNIDVPIALGIAVLFFRSTLDIAMDWGTGFFDSLTGLIFFLLVGRFFQQKTYAYLSFERDYKSYFPIGVTRISHLNGSEEQVNVYDLQKGDRVLMRNGELLPVDGTLVKGTAVIDYSFVTGESEPVTLTPGSKLFAGGKQQGGNIEVEVLKSVEQSYLTQLWSDHVFDRDKKSVFQSFTDSISKRFTLTVLAIAFVSLIAWLMVDPYKAFNVFTAILIVACPCAIALSAPFTLGNLLRIFGRNKLYLKEAWVIEQMAEIDTLIFDKTGTLTTQGENRITYQGVPLSSEEEEILSSSLRASNHPLSRALYSILSENDIQLLDEFEEVTGKGIQGSKGEIVIRAGSEKFVTGSPGEVSSEDGISGPRSTAVHISSNEDYKGCFEFENEYRTGMPDMLRSLNKDYRLMVLSGDNEGEKARLMELLPVGTSFMFNQKPEDKLKVVEKLQSEGRKVMMIGDGLNDAGALAQSEVGIAVSENINIFSPACDGIMDASRFSDLISFLLISRKGKRVIRWSFLLSLVYNIIGLGFAISGNLSPVVAAILMPLSSISIVVFTTLMSYYVSRNLK